MKLLGLIKYYFVVLFDAHRLFFTDFSNRVLFHLGPHASCSVKNLHQKLKGNSVRFAYDKKSTLYFASDGSENHFYSEKMRGYELYSNGLSFRSQKLAKSYLLDRIEFESNDLIIDCGANYSDLFLFFKKHIKPENYHTFEPSEREYQCIQRNAPHSSNNKKGLFSETREVEFYVASEGGDSSILEPSDGFQKKVIIQTITLDEYASSNALKSIKLLKLEAEGLEPEILMGAQSTLKKVEYLAVDGGEERGLKSEETLSVLTNHLLLNGFVLVGIDIASGMGRALFKRKNEH